MKTFNRFYTGEQSDMFVLEVQAANDDMEGS